MKIRPFAKNRLNQYATNRDEIKIKTDRNECGDNTICFISSIIDEAVGVFAFMFFSVGY